MSFKGIRTKSHIYTNLKEMREVDKILELVSELGKLVRVVERAGGASVLCVHLPDITHNSGADGDVGLDGSVPSIN